MLAITRVGCGFLLLWSQIATGIGQLADPEYNGGSASEVYEVLPDTSLNHYLYPAHRPQRLRLVKKTATSKSSPLQAVQKVFVAKPSPGGSSMSVSYTLGAVVLALVSQAVGTLFFLVMAKLVLGMKTILVTNTATLALALWGHLKKKKLKLKKKLAIQMPQKKMKKKPHGHTQWLQLTKKQVKNIMKLLLKKKKKIKKY